MRGLQTRLVGDEPGPGGRQLLVAGLTEGRVACGGRLDEGLVALGAIRLGPGLAELGQQRFVLHRARARACRSDIERSLEEADREIEVADLDRDLSPARQVRVRCRTLIGERDSRRRGCHADRFRVAGQVPLALASRLGQRFAATVVLATELCEFVHPLGRLRLVEQDQHLHVTGSKPERALEIVDRLDQIAAAQADAAAAEEEVELILLAKVDRLLRGRHRCELG